MVEETISSEHYKCAFCNYVTPKCIHSVHMTSDGAIQVYSSGWYDLQSHCYKDHGDEPAVKELLFSDRNLLPDIPIVSGDHLFMSDWKRNGHGLYIETSWEDVW